MLYILGVCVTIQILIMAASYNISVLHQQLDNVSKAVQYWSKISGAHTTALLSFQQEGDTLQHDVHTLMILLCMIMILLMCIVMGFYRMYKQVKKNTRSILSTATGRMPASKNVLNNYELQTVAQTDYTYSEPDNCATKKRYVDNFRVPKTKTNTAQLLPIIDTEHSDTDEAGYPTDTQILTTTNHR